MLGIELQHLDEEGAFAGVHYEQRVGLENVLEE